LPPASLCFKSTSGRVLAQHIAHGAGVGVVAGLGWEPKDVLNGAQQGVVSVGGGGRQAARLGAGTSKDRQDVVARAAVVFVPGQHEDAGLGGAGRRVQDGRQVVLEPRVAGADRAIVHIVALVGRDEHVVRGGRSRGQVAAQIGVGHHMAVAPGGVGADVIEVHKWVVLGRVGARAGEVAGRRHAFHVAFPGEALRLQVVCEVLGCAVTGRRRIAVGGDAVVAARVDLQVVRQAGVIGGVVVGGADIAVAQLRDVRRRAGVPDLAVAMVLHHHDKHMLDDAGRAGRGSIGRSGNRRRCMRGGSSRGRGVRGRAARATRVVDDKLWRIRGILPRRKL
jgi:hypothetical protein